MSFLNPLFLFALIAIGVPLLIHLLNLRRPKKIAFPTLAFFQQLQNSTFKRIRIKKYLLLALRTLAVLCLALVLARPFLPPGLGAAFNSKEPALNAILLDNSISMERISRQGPLFEHAKEIIRLIEQSSKENDRFILQLTNGAPQAGYILNRTNLLKALDEAAVSRAGNFTPQRLAALFGQLEEAPFANKKLFIISDRQSSQLAGLSNLQSKNTIITFIDAGSAEIQNTHIKSVATSTNMIGAGIPLEIAVELENSSTIPAINQFISLNFEGQPLGQYSVSLPPGESQIFRFEITPSEAGSAHGMLEIEGDAFAADNEYYFTIQVPDKLSILWIEDEKTDPGFISYTGAMLRAAGENNAQMEYTKIKPDAANPAMFAQYDAIILDGLQSIPEYLFQDLLRFVEGGKGLLFFPSEKINLDNYNAFLAQFNAGRVAGFGGEFASFRSIAVASQLLHEHPAFSGLFEVNTDEELRFSAPDIFYYLRLSAAGGGNEYNLLSLNNGDPLVREKSFGNGQLIISAIGNSPGWSNFPLKPLFAPFHYRLLLYAAASDKGGLTTHELGQPFSWAGNIDAETAVLVDNGREIKPSVYIVANGVRLQYSAEDWTPGVVTITDEHGNSHSIAKNLNTGESVFDKMAASGMEEYFDVPGFSLISVGELNDEQLHQNIIASGFGREIWHWFILAGLLFLIAETVISILYKTES